MVDFWKLVYGSGLPFDVEFHKRIAAQAFDRSLCPEGTGRQYLDNHLKGTSGSQKSQRFDIGG
jgi:hypothetical protein